MTSKRYVKKMLDQMKKERQVYTVPPEKVGLHRRASPSRTMLLNTQAPLFLRTISPCCFLAQVWLTSTSV